MAEAFSIITSYVSALTTNKLVFTTVISTAVLSLVFFSRIIRRFLSSAKYPPGPWGFPIVGVLPMLGSKTPHLTINAWWEKYGDVMSFYMGSRLVVVVNGVKAMKECFVKKGAVFEGRPDSYLKKLTKGKGLVFTEGEAWREHRRFAIGCLRDFGMGSLVLESKVHTELTYLLEEMGAEDGRSFDPITLLPKAVSNVICSIIYGSRFDYTDEIFRFNLAALAQSVRKQTLISLVNFLPCLELLPSLLPTDRLLAQNVRVRDRYAQTQLDAHRDTFDPENPRDFIDAYLARMNQRLSSGERTTMHESHLKRSIQDLFIAGTEPVTTTLRWSLLFMALHRDAQSRVQQELDRVVGPARRPSTADRPLLPLTEATLMECQRLGNIALFNVPRAAVEDTTLRGYRVPRGTWVFANRWGLHMSERYWERPERFDPGRFIDEKGEVKRHEPLHPYGMGSRSCAGESFARTELFVFFTSILQAFTLALPPDTLPPNIEPEVGLNMSPKPYLITAVRR